MTAFSEIHEEIDDSEEIEKYNTVTGEKWSRQKPLFSKTRIREELILGIIKEVEVRNSESIDLSKRDVLKIPRELLQLNQLEQLVLESNEISEIPDILFDSLPNLRWLDLRHNLLEYLPSIYIGRHKNLRTLLLQDNKLRTLPLELGFVKTLNGLNICDNPLEFPPADIIAKGTQQILTFLREVLVAKSEERKQLLLQEQAGKFGDMQKCLSVENLQIGASNSDLTSTQHGSGEGSSTSHQQCDSVFATLEGNNDVMLDNLHHVSPRLIKSDSKPPSRKSKSVTQRPSQQPNTVYYSPSAQQYVSFKMAESQKVAKQREYQVKENAILQRRRDEEMLKQWREETKMLQHKKALDVAQARRDGTPKEKSQITKTAPFGTDQEHMLILNNEERIKEDVRQTHERLRQQKLRQDDYLNSEETQLKKIQDLERRIKAHTKNMYNRRKNPASDPQAEVEAARKDLETVKDLQSDLIRRYHQLKTFSTAMI